MVQTWADCESSLFRFVRRCLSFFTSVCLSVPLSGFSSCLFFCLFLSTSLFCLSCFCSRLPVYLSFCLYLCLILPPFSVSPVSLPFLLSVYSCVLSFLFSLALRLSAFSFSLSPTKIPFLHLPSFCLVFCLLSLLSLFLPIRYLCLALAIFLSPVCLLFCIRSLVQLPPPLCFCIFVSIFFYLSVTLCLCPFCLSDSLFSPKFIFFSVLTDRASVPITSLLSHIKKENQGHTGSLC